MSLLSKIRLTPCHRAWQSLSSMIEKRSAASTWRASTASKCRLIVPKTALSKQEQVAHHLNGLNALFLQSYGIRKACVKNTLGTASPVLLLHGNNLILKYQGTTKTINYVPDHYHQIKNIAHIACTIHTLQWLQETQPSCQALKANCLFGIKSILDMLKTSEGSFALKKYEPLLQKYLTLLEEKKEQPPLLSLKEDLKNLLKEAAIIRTDALHSQVKIIQKQMCPKQWNHLAVVVMGPRMPREGELSMQYSQTMILRPPDASLAKLCPHLNSALTKTSHVFQSKRLIYVESIETIDRALDELTTEIADEVLGEALLGDKGVMRADFLKDAVREYLQTLKP